MRSSQPIEDQALTKATCSQRSLSGVCSECGTTYQVEANDGREDFQCPRCGPSIPIGDRDDEAEPRRQRRRRLYPRIRIPFVLVQMAIVSLTFVVFMGLLLSYMDRRFPSRNSGSRRPAKQGPGPSADLRMDPMTKDPAASKAGSGTHAKAGAAALATDFDANRLEGDGSVSSGDVSSGDDGRNVVSANAGMPDRPAQNGLSESTSKRGPGSATDDGEMLSLIEVASESMSIRKYKENSHRLFGSEVIIQCRLVNVYDDAAGNVPNRFDMRGHRFQLDDSDTEGFIRLEVQDAHNESLRNVFVLRDGPLRQELQWIMPGDWILITGTPGVRYENASSTKYGLVLMEIAALDENTHSSVEVVTKKLAER